MSDVGQVKVEDSNMSNYLSEEFKNLGQVKLEDSNISNFRSEEFKDLGQVKLEDNDMSNYRSEVGQVKLEDSNMFNYRSEELKNLGQVKLEDNNMSNYRSKVGQVKLEDSNISNFSSEEFKDLGQVKLEDNDMSNYRSEVGQVKLEDSNMFNYRSEELKNLGQVKLEDNNMSNYRSKVGQVKLEDSNMSNFRSEAGWKRLGQKKGLEIWRIEKFNVKRWPKERYGEFYGGDSYIILHTKENDEGKLSWDIFSWLGSETSQDEAGTAVYKTVEVDDLLGDDLIQYREVQGNESKRFLSLFPKMTILEGSIANDFNHVKPNEYKPRLLHVTGFKKHVQVYQVPIKIESLNDTDCFVLDAGLKIYQFNGIKSSSLEKRKANAIVAELKTVRDGKVKDTYIIDSIKDKGKKFWEYFGGCPDKIKDEDKEKEEPKIELSMHQVSDESFRIEIKEVGRGKLDKNKLDSNNAFLIDGGSSIFVWIGKHANKKEKREAMKFATEYLQQQDRSSNVPIARVIESKEPKEFWDVLNGKKCGGRQINKKNWKKN